MLIGRYKEVEEIINAVSQRKNLFLSGPEGVGKTFIVKHVLEKTGGTGIFYSADCTTIKTSLAGFLKGDYDSTFLSCQNISSLRKLFYKKVHRENSYLVFDHIGRVGPKFFSYLKICLMSIQHSLSHVALIPEKSVIYLCFCFPLISRRSTI